MCNIAGYAGNRQAAPILLEMLRKQAPYDGDICTGVATIHEGKLYCKKLNGNVDAFLKEFDLAELPGTIGIAHSRPGETPGVLPRHPFLNMDKTMALCANGTSPKTKYWADWDAALDMLDAAGYQFQQIFANEKGHSPKFSKDGRAIHGAECTLHLVDYYYKQGKTIREAMAIANSRMYTDMVTVMINQEYPDSIFALRHTRSMEAVMEKGETYMATTRFAFPEELKNEPIMLPLHHVCELSKDGIRICKEKMDMEPVSEMTPYTYAEGYRRLEALLKSEKAPLYFDELESAVGKEMRDLWPGDHTFVQHARLVYDMLWQFEREGRLTREMRIQPTRMGDRHRWYFGLKD